MTDNERIAELERRVYALEGALNNFKGLPMPSFPTYPFPARNGCVACEWGKRPCGCVLNAPTVTCGVKP